MSEEQRLRILKNGEPKKIQGSKREEVTEEILDAYCSPGEFYVIYTAHLLTFRILTNQMPVPLAYKK